MRFEDFGDLWFTANSWKAAYTIAHGDPQAIIGERLAERRFNECKIKWDERFSDKEPKAYVHAFLEEKIKEAQKANAEKRKRDSQDIANTIVELYSDKDTVKEMDLTDLVDKAKELQGTKPAAEKR